MNTFWKVMVGLLVTIPVAAFVTGTLIASQADVPTERPSIRISDAPSSNAGTGRPGSDDGPATNGSQSPQPSAGSTDDDGPDDGSDDRGRDGDDDDVEVIRPTPDDLSDDDGDDNGDDG